MQGMENCRKLQEKRHGNKSNRKMLFVFDSKRTNHYSSHGWTSPLLSAALARGSLGKLNEGNAVLLYATILSSKKSTRSFLSWAMFRYSQGSFSMSKRHGATEASHVSSTAARSSHSSAPGAASTYFCRVRPSVRTIYRCDSRRRLRAIRWLIYTDSTGRRTHATPDPLDEEFGPRGWEGFGQRIPDVEPVPRWESPERRRVVRKSGASPKCGTFRWTHDFWLLGGCSRRKRQPVFHLPTWEKITQLQQINQNQSINQSIKRAIEHWIERLINQSIDQQRTQSTGLKNRPSLHTVNSSLPWVANCSQKSRVVQTLRPAQGQLHRCLRKRRWRCCQRHPWLSARRKSAPPSRPTRTPSLYGTIIILNLNKFPEARGKNEGKKVYRRIFGGLRERYRESGQCISAGPVPDRTRWRNAARGEKRRGTKAVMRTTQTLILWWKIQH